MGFLRDAFTGVFSRSSLPLSWNDYQSWFGYGGLSYPVLAPPTTLSSKQEPPTASFAGYANALYKLNPVLFACAMVRLNLFAEARFQFRRFESGRPGELFGSRELGILERPWPNGTTGDLLSRAIQDADIAGNAYFARRGSALRRMRPDWVTIVLGSEFSQSESYEDLDLQVLGYLYQPGGTGSGLEQIALLPEEVCHFAPIPDPLARFRGMSWIESIIRELMADNAATEHKLKFFEQGATVNLVVNVQDPNVRTQEQFENWVDTFRRAHEGVSNSFKNMYLSAGTTVTPVGANLEQAAFKVVQGAGETRIAAAAGTPPTIVGLSEGLQGSALNAGNYAQAFRRFGDLTMRPLWRNFCGSMATLVDVPVGAELWYDDRDIPALQEDVKDAAEIQQMQSATIRQLVDAGFKPETVVEAVISGDFKRLSHSKLFSVQLQPPGTEDPSTNGAGALPIGAADE